MNISETKTPDAANHNAVELCGVSKTFYADAGMAIPALENIKLQVRQREFLTLIGPTGCGKTTLLNIMAGLENADSGTRLLAEELRLGRNIACVFQHYTLFPWRTVERNVQFGMQMRHRTRRERKEQARILLEAVGLLDFAKAYPYELSGGMRQRAALAQALAIEPKLLLMDEPFGALDAATRKELQQMLTNLWQKTNITVIFVTHNIDEALLLGDRVLVFRDRPGSIVREFNIDLPRPRDPKAKEFTDLFLQVRQSLPAGLD